MSGNLSCRTILEVSFRVKERAHRPYSVWTVVVFLQSGRANAAAPPPNMPFLPLSMSLLSPATSRLSLTFCAKFPSFFFGHLFRKKSSTLVLGLLFFCSPRFLAFFNPSFFSFVFFLIFSVFCVAVFGLSPSCFPLFSFPAFGSIFLVFPLFVAFFHKISLIAFGGRGVLLFPLQRTGAPMMFSPGAREQFWYEGVVVAFFYLFMSAAIIGVYTSAGAKRWGPRFPRGLLVSGVRGGGTHFMHSRNRQGGGELRFFRGPYQCIAPAEDGAIH